MEHRPLGRTGIQVSPLSLGTFMLGSTGTADHGEAQRIIHRALDAGINLIDTADVYSSGEAEEIVGKALAGGRRDDVVLATKVHGAMGPDPNQGGASRRWIVQAVDASLRRLKTDWIDIYQLHRFDPTTDLDQTLGAMTDLVRAGKVRCIGSSTFPVRRIVEAQWIAERRGTERFMCEQPPYSVLVRGIETEILPTCADYGLGVMTYSALNGSWLTGRYRLDREVTRSIRDQRIPDRFDVEVPVNRRKLEAVEALAQLADASAISLVHLAVAFAMRHPAVSSVILGPRTMEHLEGQLGAGEVRLSDDVLARIDEIVPPGTTINRLDSGMEDQVQASSAGR